MIFNHIMWWWYISSIASQYSYASFHPRATHSYICFKSMVFLLFLHDFSPLLARLWLIMNTAVILIQLRTTIYLFIFMRRMYMILTWYLRQINCCYCGVPFYFYRLPSAAGILKCLQEKNLVFYLLALCRLISFFWTHRLCKTTVCHACVASLRDPNHDQLKLSDVPIRRSEVSSVIFTPRIMFQSNSNIYISIQSTRGRASTTGPPHMH